MKLGITANDQKIILDILKKYTEDYCFYYYGSRIKGTYNKTSDLDILIKGKNEMPLSVLSELREEFDNSNLSYIVNFCDYYSIDESFYKIIEKDLQKIVSA